MYVYNVEETLSKAPFGFESSLMLNIKFPRKQKQCSENEDIRSEKKTNEATAAGAAGFVGAGFGLLPFRLSPLTSSPLTSSLNRRWASSKYAKLISCISSRKLV